MEKTISKKVASLLLVFAMVISFLPVNMNFSAEAAYEGFHVSGTKILDANGNEFVMRGINHAHVWWQSETDTALKAIANTGANCVRLVFTTGKHSQYKPGEWDNAETSASELESVINKSISNGLVPIVEVHDATGVNDFNALQDCANYWMKSDVKNVLKKYEGKVILNIANEWQGDHSGSSWADGYKKVIPQLRNAGINNLIMVDSAGWGQSSEAMNYCKDVFNSDVNKNTVFSVHMYSCYYNDSKVTEVIDNVLSQNVPIVIGEFGHEHSGVKVAYKKILSYCKEKNVGYIAWSWKGNGGSDANLDMSNDWAGNNLTSWGKEVVNSFKGGSSTPTDPTKPVTKGEKELWTGSVDLGSDWQQMVDVNGGTGETASGIKVYFTTNGNSELQLAYKNSAGEWTTIVDYVSVSGDSHTFELSSDQAEALTNAQNIYIKGTNATITKVTATGIGSEEEDKDIANCTISCVSKVTYNGQAQKPTVKVTNGTDTLVEGKDYTVAYSNNVEIGTATITVTGKGDYTGTATKTFRIISASQATDVDEVTYWTGSFTTGNFDKYLEVVTGIGSWANAELTVNYELVGSGEHKLQFAYADEKKGAWTYLPGTEDTECCVTVDDSSYTFELNEEQISELENAQKLYFKGKNLIIKSVTVKGAELGSDNDKDHVSTELWSGELDFPNWDVMLKIPGGIASYVGDSTKAFIRVDFDYNNDSRNASMQLACNDSTGKWTVLVDAVQPRANSYTFRLTPEFIKTLSNAQQVVIKGAGFTATKASIIVPGNNSKPVTEKKKISDCTITSASQVTFNGGNQTPAVTVKDGSKTLTNSTDYTVEYKNNAKVGTATITVTGKGNYEGTATKTFKILPKSLKYCKVVLKSTSLTYTGLAQKPAVQVKIGDKAVYSGNYTVTYKNNVNAGTATVTLTGKGNLQGTVTKTFKIVPKTIKYCTVQLKATSYSYTGSAIKPAVRVKIGNTVISSSNYTVAYKNNTNKGTASVKITGKGNLQGYVVKTFTIK